jgi:Zn-dependent protease with chaperone function
VDFYSRQAAARSHTRWLVLGFLLSLIVVTIALDLVLFAAMGATIRNELGFRTPVGPLEYAALNPGSAFFCTLVILGTLALSSAYKSLELRGGGGVVARSLGGVRVGRDTTDLKLKRLRNVVEEMAIASGVPLPEIYVLEQEPGINAFAAGHTPANAAVTVTQGALDNLNRDQLQGVIAHEFSHILNGDMRLNIQLMGWVFGLFIIALIGRFILSFSPRDRRGSNGAAAVGFAVMALGYIGLFFGRLLQAAVSRQRERLADASGVQFTRNPDGLKDALIKIAALPEGSAIAATNAEQAAHMFFAEGLSRMFATHPPLLERIKELDPHFDPRELAQIAAELQRQGALAAMTDVAGSAGTDSASATAGGTGTPTRWPAGAAPAGVSDRAAGNRAAGTPAAGTPAEGTSAGTGTAVTGAIAAVPGAATGAAIPAGVAGLAAGEVAAQVGKPETLHIEQAKTMRLALPESLRVFGESTGHAQALVLALLLSRDPAVRDRQMAILSSALGSDNLTVIQQAVPLADDLDPMLRLPALQQIFPALRRAPSPQRRALAQIANDLIHADSRLDVFEFCLAKLLETLLNDELEARTPHGTLSLQDAQNELFVLFVTLAQLGAHDDRAARIAYEAGMSSLFPMRRPPYQHLYDWPKRLSDALPRLEDLHPFAKKAAIEGLVKTIVSDEVMTVEEAELLRAVCALLHCPLPPLLSFGLRAEESAAISG